MQKVKLLDLFSGIGGFSLGLERAGFETIAFCEIEDYPRKVLAKHWPNVPIAGDIRKLSYKDGELIYDGQTIYRGAIDAICGGFPCQDISVAGNQKGITAERSGLWSELHRLISEIRPQYAIIENVTALISGSGEYEQQIDRCLCGWTYRWRRVSLCEQRKNEKRHTDIHSENRCRDGEKSKIPVGKTTQTVRRITNNDKEGNGKMGGSVEVGFDRKQSEGIMFEYDSTLRTKERTSGIIVETESEGRGDNKTTDFRIEPEGAEYNDRGGLCCPSCGREVANSTERFGKSTWYGRVLGDLAEIGFDAEWHCISASELGAHHHRDRVWIICYPEHTGRITAEIREGYQAGNGSDQKGQKPASEFKGPSDAEVLADSISQRQQGQRQYVKPLFAEAIKKWQAINAKSGCISGIWSVEPGVGRVASRIPDRAHRLKGLGNAVCPPIPELLGRAIMKYEESK